MQTAILQIPMTPPILFRSMTTSEPCHLSFSPIPGITRCTVPIFCSSYRGKVLPNPYYISCLFSGKRVRYCSVRPDSAPAARPCCGRPSVSRGLSRSPPQAQALLSSPFDRSKPLYSTLRHPLISGRVVVQIGRRVHTKGQRVTG